MMSAFLKEDMKQKKKENDKLKRSSKQPKRH